MFRTIVLTTFLSMSLLACSVRTAEEGIGLEQLPDTIKQAAYTELPGLTLTQASMESEDNRVVYELEGDASGKAYEIEITADGQILEIDEDD